ncbi:hypothetical protein [Nocardia abscessus]|uniref:hypothetical protein n=1 Tax=Nocardia abscessus TaxID=120957 RepID=UPI002458FAD5|nr:hypothetical protein [Nocardia abscessus]
MGTERTVREVVDLIVELGLIDPDTPTRLTLVAESLDEPLTYYGHTERSAVLTLLSEVGIRYTLDYKTFRGIDECTDDERREWYETELESIAACSRGRVAVTNVRLVENDTKSELLFDCNGVTESWPVYPGDDEDVEASLVFATSLTGIHTGVVERFCSVDPPDEDVSGEAVFGDPEALNRLGAHFGLTFAP